MPNDLSSLRAIIVRRVKTLDSAAESYRSERETSKSAEDTAWLIDQTCNATLQASTLRAVILDIDTMLTANAGQHTSYAA